MEKLNQLIEKYNISEKDLFTLSLIETKKSEVGYVEKEKLKAKTMNILKPYKIGLSDSISLIKELPKLNYNRKEIAEKYPDVNIESIKSPSKLKIFIPIIIAVIVFSVIFQIITDETACDCANILKEKQDKWGKASESAANGNGEIRFDNDHWIKRGKRCMEKYTKMKEWEIESYQSSGTFISEEAIENARKECDK